MEERGMGLIMNCYSISNLEARMLQYERDKFRKDLVKYHKDLNISFCLEPVSVENGEEWYKQYDPRTLSFIAGYLCSLGLDINEMKTKTISLKNSKHKEGMCKHFYVYNNREGPASLQCPIKDEIYSCCTRCSMYKM